MFKPKFMVIDFEKAIHSAFLNVWPKIIINYCGMSVLLNPMLVEKNSKSWF